PVDDNSEHDFNLYCADKRTGKILWEKTSYTGVPKVKRHPKATHANCTPATNGKYVVAFFASEGLYCYDMDGNLQWEKDLGKLDAGAFNADWAEWEFASSPIIYKDVVLVQCDVRGDSFIAAYDLKTGKQKWKIMRDEYPGWCTPNIYTLEGKDYVVVNGYKHRGAYDFITGEEVWKMSGGGDVPIPTPIIGHNMIYFNSAHGKSSPILAIKTSAKGDITLKKDELTNDYVTWSIPRGAGYMQTMLIYGDYLYSLKWNGSLTCYNAKTGEQLYKETLERGISFTASPIASDGKIYVTDDNGIVYTVQTGKDFKLLSKNSLGDICMTTPAITDSIIYFRTMKYLVAISK
ncbi:MAG: pyrrolo-quinoline quinone, partial [Bacteroidetes bacterium]